MCVCVCVCACVCDCVCYATEGQAERASQNERGSTHSPTTSSGITRSNAPGSRRRAPSTSSFSDGGSPLPSPRNEAWRSLPPAAARRSTPTRQCPTQRSTSDGEAGRDYPWIPHRYARGIQNRYGGRGRSVVRHLTSLQAATPSLAPSWFRTHCSRSRRLPQNLPRVVK
eukprot:COSAG05_NODE_561_length_8675_cov_3.694846_8_plen_169_part_00